jgi:hypothetical protein
MNARSSSSTSSPGSAGGFCTDESAPAVFGSGLAVGDALGDADAATSGAVTAASVDSVGAALGLADSDGSAEAVVSTAGASVLT